MNSAIDIIIPWVDSADEAWQEEKRRYMDAQIIDDKANSAVRYQSWDNLQYWFRAVEKYMPWFHQIIFVTWGHLPEFLDISNPKLQIIRHEDYIPKEYLPTFNSNVIEMNYHRINELSENFVIFNDDVFPLRPIEETYYFEDNMICDEAVENPIMPVDMGENSRWMGGVRLNNMMFINRHFKKREVQGKNWDKWFCDDYGELLERNLGLRYWYDFAGFRDPHMPSAMKKSTLAHLWQVEPDTLDRACRNRFRSETDLSQYLIRYWQLCEGNFLPRRTEGKPAIITLENYRAISEGIRKHEWQMLSMNEEAAEEDFEIVKLEINYALAALFPEKSTFEL